MFLLGIVLFVLLSSSFVLVGVSSVIWTQSYGDASDQNLTSIVKTADGGFALAGETKSLDSEDYDFWLVKTDSSGNMEWNRTYGRDLYDFVNSLIETSGGEFVLFGTSRDYYYSDFWLVKTDAYGNVKWNRTYGKIYRDYGHSVVET